MNKEIALACRKDEKSLLLDYTASTKWEDIANLEWSTAEVMEVMRQYRTLVEEKFTSTNSAMVPCNQYMKQSSVTSVCPIGHFNCGASPCMITQHQ